MIYEKETVAWNKDRNFIVRLRMKKNKIAAVGALALASCLLCSCHAGERMDVQKMNRTYKDDHFTYAGHHFSLETGSYGYVESENFPDAGIIVDDGLTNYMFVKYQDDAEKFIKKLVKGHFGADKTKIDYVYWGNNSPIEDVDFEDFFEENHKGMINVRLYFYDGDIPSIETMKDEIIEIADEADLDLDIDFMVYDSKKADSYVQSYALNMDEDDHIVHIYLNDSENDDNDGNLVEDMDLD